MYGGGAFSMIDDLYCVHVNVGHAPCPSLVKSKSCCVVVSGDRMLMLGRTVQLRSRYFADVGKACLGHNVLRKFSTTNMG